MTWREFQLKRFAYERQRKEEWRHTREIAYWIYLSIPTKEAKINKEQFFPIDSKGKSNVKTSQFARKFLEEQQKEYYRQKNGSRI